MTVDVMSPPKAGSVIFGGANAPPAGSPSGYIGGSRSDEVPYFRLESQVDDLVKSKLLPLTLRMQRMTTINYLVLLKIKRLKKETFISNMRHLKKISLHKWKNRAARPNDEDYTAPWLKNIHGEWFTFILEKILQIACTILFPLGAIGFAYAVGRCSYNWVFNGTLDGLNTVILSAGAFTFSQMVLQGKKPTSDPLAIVAWNIVDFTKAILGVKG